MPTMTPVPDLIEPIVAYRAWRFRILGREARIGPLGTDDGAWAAARRSWSVAACLLQAEKWSGSFASRHVAPDERCTCGFYATKTVDLAAGHLAMHRGGLLDPSGRRASTREGVVLGRVQLAGKVIEHEVGYRAQRARVLELIPLAEDGTTWALAARLGVPVAEPFVEPPLARLIEDARAAERAERVRAKLAESERLRSLTQVERLRLLIHQRLFRVIQGGRSDRPS